MRRVGVALLLCFLLSGCSWKDAGDLSAVTAGAVSKSGQRYQLTAELAVPDADSAVPASKQVSGSAQTMEQAIDNTGTGLDTQLYWSHARVLFFDDTVLETGIRSCVRQLHADSAVRPSVRLCVVRDELADEIFSCASISGEPIGFSVGDSLSYAVQQSQMPDMPLYRVYNALETQGIDPVLPAVSIQGEQAQLDGCALFSGETCTGWLNQEQTAVLALLLHSGEQAVLYDDGEPIALRKLRVQLVQGRDTWEIRLRAEAACDRENQLQRTARVAQEQCTRVIERLKQANCDALGIGRLSGQAWRTVPVNVSVTMTAAQSAEGGNQ
jgi:hypothetical protein